LTWLATITRNKCIDRMRKSGRRISVVPEGFEWNAPRVDERTIDPYRAAALSDLAGSIRECLDRLPLSQRIVLESAYFECLSIDQMAARFNLPYHTIKSRIRLAKEKLRKHLLLNCEGYNSAEGFL
jgi:RNA polymerase sigma-70 factor (ECF subfamily)